MYLLVYIFSTYPYKSYIIVESSKVFLATLYISGVSLTLGYFSFDLTSLHGIMLCHFRFYLLITYSMTKL